MYDQKPKEEKSPFASLYDKPKEEKPEVSPLAKLYDKPKEENLLAKLYNKPQDDNPLANLYDKPKEDKSPLANLYDVYKEEKPKSPVKKPVAESDPESEQSTGAQDESPHNRSLIDAIKDGFEEVKEKKRVNKKPEEPQSPKSDEKAEIEKPKGKYSDLGPEMFKI